MTDSFVFPSGDLSKFEPVSGITLRDYFAAKAMQALIQTKILKFEWFSMNSDSCIKLRNLKIKNCSNVAYQIADAMLKEREKQNA